MLLKKSFNKPKTARLEGRSIKDPKFYCDMDIVADGLVNIKRFTAEIFRLLQLANRDIMESNLSVRDITNDLKTMNDRLQNIIDYSTCSICMTNEEKYIELRALVGDMTDYIVGLKSYNDICDNIITCLDLFRCSPQILNKDLLTSVNNGDCFYKMYDDISREQRSELKRNTLEFRKYLKRLGELNKLAISAIDINSYKECYEQMQKFSNLCQIMLIKFDKLDKVWEGKLSEFMQYKDYSAKAFINNCINGNIKCMLKFNNIGKYNTKIPYVKGEERDLAEYSFDDRNLVNIYRQL